MVTSRHGHRLSFHLMRLFFTPVALFFTIARRGIAVTPAHASLPGFGFHELARYKNPPSAFTLNPTEMIGSSAACTSSASCHPDQRSESSHSTLRRGGCFTSCWGYPVASLNSSALTSKTLSTPGVPRDALATSLPVGP